MRGKDHWKGNKEEKRWRGYWMTFVGENRA